MTATSPTSAPPRASSPASSAITPAAGFVSGMAPIAIGAHRRRRLLLRRQGSSTKVGYDDALDVVGVHFVGGLVGSLAVGLFANPDFFGLDSARACSTVAAFSLLGEQLFANVAVAAYSFGVTLLILVALKRMIGIRVSEEVETAGIDQHLHNEIAYDFGALVGWITSNGHDKVDAELESEREFAEGERELEELDREIV